MQGHDIKGNVLRSLQKEKKASSDTIPALYKGGCGSDKEERDGSTPLAGQWGHSTQTGPAYPGSAGKTLQHYSGRVIPIEPLNVNEEEKVGLKGILLTILAGILISITFIWLLTTVIYCPHKVYDVEILVHYVDGGSEVMRRDTIRSLPYLEGWSSTTLIFDRQEYHGVSRFEYLMKREYKINRPLFWRSSTYKQKFITSQN